MNNYGTWTVENLQAWNYLQPNILEVQFDAVMNNFDHWFLEIFKHLSFSPRQTKEAIKLARKHDLGRKSNKEIEKMKHVSSKNSSKWQEYFEDCHKEKFKSNFGNILIDLGYEKNNDW